MKPNVSIKAHANALGANKCRCSYCGIEGEYGKDIVDIDHLDRLGKSTLRPFCLDLEACLDRGRG